MSGDKKESGQGKSETVSDSPVNLDINLKLVAEVIKSCPGKILFVYEMSNANKYPLTLNSRGQLCIIKKEGMTDNLLLVETRRKQFVLDRESTAIINRYLVDCERARQEIGAIRRNDKLSLFALLGAVSAPPALIPVMPAAVKPLENAEKRRSLTLINICQELSDREGSYSFEKAPDGKLKIKVVFASERRAAFMQRKLLTRWSVDCVLDWQDRRKLVIEDSFSRDEIEIAEKYHKITIPR